MMGGGLGGDLGGGDMDLDGTPDAMEGGGATGSTDMSSAPAASSGQPLQEKMSRKAAGKSVIDQYLDMLSEKQRIEEKDNSEQVYTILEESENEAKSLDFLLERVEKLIGEDDTFKNLGIGDPEDDDQLSGDTVSDEDLLTDEE
jgi:hypothetical protein